MGYLETKGIRFIRQRRIQYQHVTYDARVAVRRTTYYYDATWKHSHYVLQCSTNFVGLTIMQFKLQGIEQVQALADISRSALCYHSNETRAPIANPPNIGTLHNYREPPTIPPSYTRVHAVVWECDEGQTDRHTDGQQPWPIYISPPLCLT